MDRVEFLPLGSVVVVRGAIRKTLIVARGLAANITGETRVFDYGGCVYPEGLVGDQLGYFNHEDIARVVFEGFRDEDNTMMVENINNWLAKTTFLRGNPVEINEQTQASQSA
ncbi:MAG: DUF4176 domain-containing protein [Propionibacteriaceae bacterium]|jgi:hypothetical protein|nr:DUF4176 domain-containing protein [Propionibacteriaceae bacterium]